MDSRILGGKDNTPMTVDQDGHAHVRSVCVEPIEQASWNEDAYHILAEATLTGTADTPLLWLQNDKGGKDKGRKRLMVINNVLLTADADVYCEVWVGSAYTSGGGAAAVASLNRGTVDTADVTAKDGSSAMVLSTVGATELDGIYLGAYRPFSQNYDGKLLLPRGKTFAVIVKGASGNNVHVSLDFYWAPEPE